MPLTVPDATLLLPEDLRLPDLSGIRSFTVQDRDDWYRMAVAALEWGPDERNGCVRDNGYGLPMWLDRNERLHSPDRWTPAYADDEDADWFERGDMHSVSGQPAGLARDSLTWRTHGNRHRLHAPAIVYGNGSRDWRCHAGFASDGMAALLNRAWDDVKLDDDTAGMLLHQGLDVPAGRGVPVSAQAWLAHVIAANPSPHLSSDMRRWCHLLQT